MSTATVSGRGTTRVDASARGEDFYVATSGDFRLATRGDFFMATDTPGRPMLSLWVGDVEVDRPHAHGQRGVDLASHGIDMSQTSTRRRECSTMRGSIATIHPLSIATSA